MSSHWKDDFRSNSDAGSTSSLAVNSHRRQHAMIGNGSFAVSRYAGELSPRPVPIEAELGSGGLW